jgi:Tfp pilus assembly protein PilF
MMKKSFIVLLVVAAFLRNTTAWATPKTADEYINRGEEYFAKGNFDLDTADLDQAIRVDPNGTNLYRHRAFSYMKKGNYKQARADVNKSMQLNLNYQSAQDLSAKLRQLGY